MKKDKKQVEKQQFPSIYRRIAERGLWQNFWLLIWVLMFIMVGTAIGFFGLDLYKNFQKDQLLAQTRAKLQSDLNTWQSISQKYQNYKEAYFQMAVIEYKLGDYAKAQEYLTETLLLDPNYDQATKLKSLLEKK